MQLVAWGANSHGQLGIAKICELVAEPVFLHESLLANIPDLGKIKRITGGGGHSLVLLDDGTVYGCGWNSSGQLAADEDPILTFTKLPYLEDYHVVQLASAWDSSYAVTSCGLCIAWGSNSFSQLGRPADQLGLTRHPVILANDVKEVACGGRHCVILKTDGSVYTVGDNRQGKLGRDAGKTDHSLGKVDCLNGIKSIACGFNHNLALSESGNIYGWGCNKWGQLCLDSRKEERFIPKPIKIDLRTQAPVPICSIQAGWSSTHVLTKDGRVISFGRNNYGQLGEEGILSDVIDISVGSEHCLALTKGGRLIAWGWNEHGSCGSGSTENQLRPMLVKINPQHRIICFAAASAHNFALLAES